MENGIVDHNFKYLD